MPIYEFHCQECQRKSSFLLRGSSPDAPRCPTCGSAHLTRIISSFAHHKSEKTRLDEAGEPKMFPGLDDYKDPRNIGRWTEKRAKELGLELPSPVEEMIQAARQGELPDSVKDL